MGNSQLTNGRYTIFPSSYHSAVMIADQLIFPQEHSSAPSLKLIDFGMAQLGKAWGKDT